MEFSTFSYVYLTFHFTFALFSYRFRVVHSSSEETGYPASELNVHSPSTRGWQSDKFCQWPQEIGVELLRGESRFSQVQVLSHQAKIATKIELFVGQGHSYNSATWKRLGYLSLDSNERSSYQARELKTVYIDQVGRFVKLVIHKNFVNKQNMFNQVGIVAINLLGQENTSSTGSLTGDHTPIIINPLNDLSIDMNLDPMTAERLRLLSDAKARAVATEDYITAKKIKAVEGELSALGSRLAQLDSAKRNAVADEDYDKAKEIKDEVDILRADIEQKILAIRIVGVTDQTTITTTSHVAHSRAQQKQHHSPDSHTTPGGGGPSNAYFGESKSHGEHKSGTGIMIFSSWTDCVSLPVLCCCCAALLCCQYSKRLVACSSQCITPPFTSSISFPSFCRTFKHHHVMSCHVMTITIHYSSHHRALHNHS